MDYRALYADLVARYDWPSPEDPRRAEREARGWEDVRMLLLARIGEGLRLDPYRPEALEARLLARVGEGWYLPGKAGAVAELLEASPNAAT